MGQEDHLPCCDQPAAALDAGLRRIFEWFQSLVYEQLLHTPSELALFGALPKYIDAPPVETLRCHPIWYRATGILVKPWMSQSLWLTQETKYKRAEGGRCPHSSMDVQRSIPLHMLGRQPDETTDQPTHSLFCHHQLFCGLNIAKGVEKGLRQAWVTWGRSKFRTWLSSEQVKKIKVHIWLLPLLLFIMSHWVYRHTHAHSVPRQTS